MQLWRIDANFDADDPGDACGWSLFARSRKLAESVAASASRIGWLTDVYPEDIGAAAETVAAALCVPSLPWPQLPVGRLVAIASDLKANAALQLDAIKVQQAAKRLAWEAK